MLNTKKPSVKAITEVKLLTLEPQPPSTTRPSWYLSFVCRGSELEQALVEADGDPRKLDNEAVAYLCDLQDKIIAP